MKDQAKTHIVTRKVPFDFPDDIHPHWMPTRPEMSQIWNGFSLTMPFLEPYLIRTMREGMKKIDDPQVLADPDLARIEDDMRDYYAKLSKKSLTRKMAYSAGFESMTLGAARFIIGERKSLFAGADTRVASFWMWHMVEETEHKTCAYDAYQAACGGYWSRAYGVFHGTWGVLWPGLRAAARRALEQLAQQVALRARDRFVPALREPVHSQVRHAVSQPAIREGSGLGAGMAESLSIRCHTCCSATGGHQ